MLHPTQNKEDLEEWYQKLDPWGYKTNPEDAKRKRMILTLLPNREFQKALDIGCGEGFITQDLPAKEIWGYELSDLASSRFPSNVKRLEALEGQFDLIIATGVIYPFYQDKYLVDKINEMATGIVLTSHVIDWLDGEKGESEEIKRLKNQIFEMEFKYRDYTQKLRIYDYKNHS